MSKKHRADKSSDVSRDAPASENSDAMEVHEPVPPLSVTIEVDAEFAAALLRVTGQASLREAVLIATREGFRRLSVECSSTQKQAIDALFRATEDDFRRVMKVNGAGS